MEINVYIKSLTALIATCFLTSSASADIITGQVVDTNGVGVFGVDIDIDNVGSGGDPPITNDGTDAQGFFSIVVPTGLYRVIFNPPPPPASTHLILEVDDVVVVGTKNMGAVVLPPGVALTGSLSNQASQPVAGVNIDVIDKVSGDNLTLVGDTTDAFGNFALAVPANQIEVRFDTTPVFGPLLAPQAIGLTPTGDTDIGTLVMPPGFLVTATVLGPGGTPVENVDIDAENDVTGEEAYTPSDNTNAAGFVDIVLAAGIYDINFCPPGGSTLAGAKANAVTISATTALGIVNMEQGLLLSGTVLDFNGAPHGGVDVNAISVATGLSLNLCGDNTNGTGFYSVRVPAGTYNVQFSPPVGLGLAADFHQNVVVNSNTTLNGTLPSDQLFTYCPSKASSSGCLAVLSGTTATSPVSGANNFSVTMTTAQAGRPGIFFGSTTAAASISFQGGLLCVQPPLKRSLILFTGGTANQCNGTFNLLINDGNAFPPSGFGFDAGPGGTSYMQAWYRDSGLMDGFDTALSNAMEIHWQ